MKQLILVRHVSGAGSSTFANNIENLILGENAPFIKCTVRAADDFFTDDEGNYNFNPQLLNAAHKECLDSVETDMQFQTDCIFVTNTLTTRKELTPYYDLAEKYGYQVHSIIVENRHGNKDIHNVPEEKRIEQESKLLNSIKLR